MKALLQAMLLSGFVLSYCTFQMSVLEATQTWNRLLRGGE
jgi:hypothetical protein